MLKAQLEKSVLFETAHINICKYKNLQNISHWHKEHELVYAESGTSALMINGTLFNLSAGMCAVIGNENIHYLQSHNDAVTVVVKFNPVYFKKFFGNQGLVCPVLNYSYPLQAYISEITDELKRNDDYSGIIADSIFVKLLALIFRNEKTIEMPPILTRKAENKKELLSLIDEKFAYITFDDAAKFMNFSRPYFSKYFFRNFGMTFTGYLNIIKISVAIKMLQEEQSSITEISQTCGFNTIRHFNRVFKELTGYTPSNLPKDYDLTHNIKEHSETDFDPTLKSTVVLKLS